MSIAQESSWTLPTTIDGQPDLQGVWGNNTITPVERPTRFGERQYLTDEEQTLLEDQSSGRRNHLPEDGNGSHTGTALDGRYPDRYVGDE